MQNAKCKMKNKKTRNQSWIRHMISRKLAPIALSLIVACSAHAADSPPALQQQLMREPVVEIAKAAREKGDAARGAVLFFQPFLTCAKCHDGDGGTQLGPDIAKIGKEGTANYLI